MRGIELRIRVADVLKHTAKNYTTPREFFDNYRYFFYQTPLPLPNPVDSVGEGDVLSWASWGMIYKMLRDVAPQSWTADTLKETLSNMTDAIFQQQQSRQVTLEGSMDRKAIYKAVQLVLRSSIACGGSGPPMHTTMTLLGRELCLQRFLAFASAIGRASNGWEGEEPL